MKRLLYLFVLFACTHAFAADGLKFAIDPDGASTKLRYNYGDSLVYQVSLINEDTFGYSGLLYAGFSAGDGLVEDSVLIGNVQIGGSDTLPFDIQIPVTPQYFKAGPEVVVVWPIIGFNKGRDFIDFIFVDDVLGVNDLNALSEPVVEGSLLSFRDYAINEPKHVRIMNSFGGLIYESVEQANELQLPVLAKGIYFVEVRSRDYKTSVLKFIR